MLRQPLEYPETTETRPEGDQIALLGKYVPRDADQRVIFVRKVLLIASAQLSLGFVLWLPARLLPGFNVVA